MFLTYLSERRFIQEITQKLPNNVGVSFINKKAPRLVRLILSNMKKFYSLVNSIWVQIASSQLFPAASQLDWSVWDVSSP